MSISLVILSDANPPTAVKAERATMAASGPNVEYRFLEILPAKGLSW